MKQFEYFFDYLCIMKEVIKKELGFSHKTNKQGMPNLEVSDSKNYMRELGKAEGGRKSVWY